MKAEFMSFGNIPFANGPTTDDLGVSNRAKQYIRFIDEYGGPRLDVGHFNHVTRRLQEAFGEIDSTEKTDFNHRVATPKSYYKTIFCFEILEHLMNPAGFMRALHSRLYNYGVIYLSTPKVFLSVYHSPHHFTEYKPAKLEILFDYCGLKVEKKMVFCQFPWWFMFYGVRPFFRVLFHRNIVYKLRRK